MKPGVSIDERGVLLHVTTEDGETVSVPLDASTLVELSAGLERARARLLDRAGRKQLLRQLGKLVWELMSEK